MIDEHAVMEAYRLLLNRKPESADVIVQKGKLETVDALVQSVVKANEFLFAHRSALLRHLYPRPVQAQATPLPLPAFLPIAESVVYVER